jgi:hypothetical protein
MPSIHDPIPSNMTPFRLMAVLVHDKFTRPFTVPEFEVGIVKAGWRGRNVDVQPTNEVVYVENNPTVVYQRLVARYGEEPVRRYHPGPERLGEDMDRYAASTQAWIKLALANEEEQEKKRIAADRAARAAQAEAATAAGKAGK